MSVAAAFFSFQLGFTPCKAEQQLQGSELDEKEEKDEKDIRKLITKKPKKKGVY